jgi:hypothetical protein
MRKGQTKRKEEIKARLLEIDFALGTIRAAREVDGLQLLTPQGSVIPIPYNAAASVLSIAQHSYEWEMVKLQNELGPQAVGS